jgi:hypothetical protein
VERDLLGEIALHPALRQKTADPAQRVHGFCSSDHLEAISL